MKNKAFIKAPTSDVIPDEAKEHYMNATKLMKLLDQGFAGVRKHDFKG